MIDLREVVRPSGRSMGSVTATSEAVASRDGGRTLLALIWLGLALQIVGQVIDVRWHATHPEFETASDQLQAHWLLWVGALVTLAAAAAAVRVQVGNRGLMLTLGASIFYVAVSIWHFLEHASGTDPELPHVLLLLGKIGIVVGVVWASVVWRRHLREG